MIIESSNKLTGLTGIFVADVNGYVAEVRVGDQEEEEEEDREGSTMDGWIVGWKCLESSSIFPREDSKSMET
jgi:hypothetical protein